MICGKVVLNSNRYLILKTPPELASLGACTDRKRQPMTSWST